MTRTEERRIPREDAIAVAETVQHLIGETVTRFQVCGSIRRAAPFVKDIEIVCEPIRIPLQPGLFSAGENGPWRDLLHEKCDRLRAAGVIEARLDKNGRPAWGEKYKRMIVDGVPVDLFAVTPPAQWGVIVAIRTGPADFSHRLVTSKSHGGWLPYGYSVKDGAIRNSTGMVIATPTERDVFAVLGRPWTEPEERA